MLKKIKVIHIITRLDKGGSAENVILTCQKLDKKKYDVVLIYGLSQVSNLNLQFHHYEIDELVREISPVKDIIAFWKIYKIIKTEKPDIVHTHTSKTGILGRWATFLLRTTYPELRTIKTIHTPHGHVFYGYFGKIKTTIFLLIEKLTAKITDKLLALTEGEKNESIKFGVGKLNQWEIVPSGVDYDYVKSKIGIKNEKLLKELNIQKGTIVIGTVARLEPVKGVRYFIEAIKLIYSSFVLNYPLLFLIVGDGSERKKLEQEVKKSELQKKIIFTGMRDDVEELISLMDIYVQPSLNEGMGKTIVIAQLLGKPVVSTKVQGIPSIVLDNYTGLLVNPKDSFSLAEAIIKLIKDEKLRLTMGHNAQLWVNKLVDNYPQFSVQRMIYLLDKFYTQLYTKTIQ